MSGIVSFIISAQDRLSAPLAKMSNNSATAKGALGKLIESNKQLKLMMGESGKSVNQLNNQIAKLKQYRDLLPSSAEKQIRACNSEINKLNKELTRLETINGSSIKKWAKDAFEGLPQMAKNPIVLAIAAITAGLNQGMKDARGKLDFGLLVGDKKAGSQIYTQLQKANPITGGAAIESGKQLLNSGFDSNKVADTVNRLGAVSMGDVNKMSNLTSAFAQLNKEGKLTEDVLQMMNDAGFKPLTILSEKTGKSFSNMQKRMEDGKISIKDVSYALQVATDKGGTFGNVLDNLQKDPTTMWDTLKSKVSEVAGQFGGLFLPIVSGALEYATIGMNYLGTAIDWVGGVINSVTGFVKDNEDVMWALVGAVTGGVLAWKAYQVWQVLSYACMMRNVIAETLMTGEHGALTLATSGLAGATAWLNAMFLASPIGWIVGGFALIVGGVVLAWNKFEGFRKAVYGIWESIKTIFGNIGKFFGKVFGMNVGEYESVGEAWGKGVAKGAASWKKSQEEKEKEKNGATVATDKLFSENGLPKLDFKSEVPPKADDKTKDGINAVSGGGAKVINVTIHKMIESMVQYVSGGKEAAQVAEQELEVALARVMQSLR